MYYFVRFLRESFNILLLGFTSPTAMSPISPEFRESATSEFDSSSHKREGFVGQKWVFSESESWIFEVNNETVVGVLPVTAAPLPVIAAPGSGTLLEILPANMSNTVAFNDS